MFIYLNNPNSILQSNPDSSADRLDLLSPTEGHFVTWKMTPLQLSIPRRCELLAFPLNSLFRKSHHLSVLHGLNIFKTFPLILNFLFWKKCIKCNNSSIPLKKRGQFSWVMDHISHHNSRWQRQKGRSEMGLTYQDRLKIYMKNKAIRRIFSIIAYIYIYIYL